VAHLFFCKKQQQKNKRATLINKIQQQNITLKKNKMKNKISLLILLLFPSLWTNLNAQSCQGLEPVFFGGIINCATAPYKLIFYDDFNGTSINTNKWYTYGPTYPNNDDQSLFSRTHDINTTPATFKELQVYKDQNVIVSNGTLKLRAKNETSTWFGVTKNYTSGYIQAKTPFKYGKIEVRIKLPAGSGFWPAVWLWGAGTSASAIDEMHEIDIIEHCGEEPSKHHITYHYKNNTTGCDATQSPYSYNSVNFTTGFHTLVCEFNPQFIKVYCDGTLVRYEPVLRTILGNLTQCGDNLANGTYLFSNFTPTIYQNLIINLALSSVNASYCNGVNNGTPFPSDMEVDYVKVWQQNIQPGSVDLCNRSFQGASTLCSNTQYTFTLNDAAYNSYTLTASPNLTINSINYSTRTIVVTPNSSGNGWIRATMGNDDPCSPNSIIQKDINVSINISSTQPSFQLVFNPAVPAHNIPSSYTARTPLVAGATSALWSNNNGISWVSGTNYTAMYNGVSTLFSKYPQNFQIPAPYNLKVKLYSSCANSLITNIDLSGLNKTIIIDSTNIIKLNDEIKTNEIFISPNPATDILKAIYKYTNSKVKTFEVFGINGIKYKVLLVSDNGETINLDISSLPQGIYIIKFFCDNGVYINKFSKI